MTLLSLLPLSLPPLLAFPWSLFMMMTTMKKWSMTTVLLMTSVEMQQKRKAMEMRRYVKPPLKLFLDTFPEFVIDKTISV